MNTREVLNEAFFKKTTYKDRLNKKLPAYAPVGQDKIKGVGGSFDLNPFNVTDSNELKKRLTSAFGVAFGNNSVRAMAQKSIKTFPIIVSDNIEPETVVMFKRYLEEQYAEYINLLIQNQVIDISQFTTGTDDGNVAIQAVDSLSNPDLSSNRIANVAKSGDVSLNDLTANIPLARLISNEQVKFKPGGKLLNTLFEDAVIVPNEYADQVSNIIFNEDVLLEDAYTDTVEDIKVLISTTDDLKREIKELYEQGRGSSEVQRVYRGIDRLLYKVYSLQELPDTTPPGNGMLGRYVQKAQRYKHELVGDISKLESTKDKLKEIIDRVVEPDKIINDYRTKTQDLEYEIEKLKAEIDGARETKEKAEKQRQDYYDALTKLQQGDPHHPKPALSTTQLVVNDKQFQAALDMTVSEMLAKNPKVRDRFEKATFLLQTNIIAGKEYSDYCIYRLGIPLSKEVRQKLAISYKMSDVKTMSAKNGETWHGLVSKADLKNISKNRKISSPLLKSTCKLKGRDYAKSIIAGVGAGVGAGAGIGIANAASIPVAAALIGGPMFGPIIAGAFVGGTALATLFQKLKKHHDFKKNSAIRGWERVEALIEDLDRQIESVSSEKDKLLTSFNDRTAGKYVSDRIIDTVKDPVSAKAYTDQAKEFNSMNKNLDGKSEDPDSEKEKAEIVAEIVKQLAEIKQQLNSNQTQTVNEECDRLYRNAHDTFDLPTDEDIMLFEAAYKTLYDNDPNFRASIVSEAAYIPNVTSPINVKNITYDPKNMMVTPAYSARSNYGYGEIEMDRRDLKDRKYNAPLVMTVHFKERLSDGKYSDNELTAVIGIQGVVYRVPSDEMKYILKQNAEGITLKGALKGGNIGDAIADLLTGAKIKKDVEKLPVSADVWHNLEKIGHLAVANKLGGKAQHNIANAHIIFSQKEIDDLRNEDGIDYLKDKSLAEQLVKRYNAFSVMVANDPGERVFVYDDPDSISWNVIPYSALRNRDSSDQLTSALIRASSGRI